MASTIESQSSQQYVDFDEYIEYQLQRTRGNIKTTDILTAFAFVAVFVLAYLLLFVIGDHWLVEDGFSQTTRIALLSLVSLLSAGWLAWKVLWPYLRQVNALFAAKMIERSQPELRSTLLNLIDARSAGKELSPAILSAMEKRAALSISQTNVDEAVDRRPLMWACYAVLGLVVLFTLYTLFTPKKVSASVWRALFPASALEAPTQTVIENVDPGDAEVIPGTRLEVLADISGHVPENVILHYSTADREFVDEPIEMRKVPDMPRRYRAQIIGTNGEGIQQDLNYYIKAGDARSVRHAVTVRQPPTADIVELHYSYPAYMGREARTRPTGNIDDYEGVIVTFLAEGNMPLKSATITFQDDHGTNFRAESVPMSAIDAERTRFRARWVLSIREEDGIYPRYYTIECKNERGESDPNPTRWPIRIHPDQRPEVKILNPRESELERPVNAVLPLTAFASDDFKVKSLTLWKQLNDQPPLKHGTLFEGAESSLSVDYDWRLNADWSLKVGDKVSYWVQAQDNRAPSAGKRNSDKYVILIHPEQPEEAVKQQLESDRRQQQPESNKNDSSEKNPDKAPPKNKPRPQDEEMENEDPDKQPMPRENPPEESQENQNGEEGGAGDASKSESQEAGDGDSRSEKTGDGGESVKNDGTQDDKALESLHEHINKNKPDPGQENPNPDTENANQSPDNKPGEKNKDSSKTDTNKPSETQPPGKNNQPDQDPKGDQTQPEDSNKTEGPDKQPADAAEQKPEEDPSSKKPEAAEKGTENKQDNPPMRNGQEKTPSPMKSEPDPKAEKTEDTESRPNETPPGDEAANDQKPDADNATKPDPQKPEGPAEEGGPDENMGEGTPSDSTDPSAAKQDKGTGGMETKPSEDGAGRDAEKPLTGNEKPADPDKNAQKRTASGEETGPATSQEDPNADAKTAKNNLDRKDSEDPTATREREGEAEDLSPDKTPKKPAEDKAPEDTQPAGKKPNAADPKDTTRKPGDPEENTQERPEPAPDADPNRKSAPPEKQPSMGDEEPKGSGRPEDQQANKPDSREGGGGKQNDQGTPGGNEKGPGDQTPRPGSTDPKNQPNGGKPGEESGEGSRTRPTKSTEEGPPRKGMPTESTDPQEAPTSDKLGENATPSPSERTPGKPGTENRPGQAGPPDSNQSRPANGPMTPEAARAAEEANLEYGRQATDLALKKLENELKRGEVDEEWLKEMGWDKADAAQFLDRMKDRMSERDQNTPEALAKQRQFNEWLKRLNKPTGQTSRRSGNSVKNESARDLFNAPKAAPPAELRDLYEAWQRGISERSK